MKINTQEREKQGIVLTRKKMVLLIVIAAALVCGGVAVGMNWQKLFGEDPVTADTDIRQPDLDEGAVDWQGVPETEQAGDAQEGIAIPGYKSIALKAGQLQQAVSLHNPAGNDCYFVMSLLLPDGTEIWKSKMVAPGMGLYEITLNQELSAGTYENSTLKYECYKRDDALTPLNGGEVKLTLEVSE